MAHLHKKIKKGRPYYYVREIARVNGKTKVINQVYIGSVEKILSMAQSKGERIEKLQVQEFGSLWLANLIEKEVGLVDIIDSVIPKRPRDIGPSVGEYFLYAVFNRMIAPRSKDALADWYKSTAIQHIRPVDITALTSQGFWKKWDRVDENQLREIANLFFRKLKELEPPSSQCFMFDTSNYYTFMASHTKSELAQRGKNKEGRNWLRQIGLALLVDRNNYLPYYFREYEGNRHDSRLFLRVMDEVIGAMRDMTGGCGEITIVFDKGMNSEDNILEIDKAEQVHFITTYSPYYADNLIHVRQDKFKAADTPKNQALKKLEREEDMLVAWRTTGEYWGKERTVVVTYNPLTATKQRYSFEKKMLHLQDSLFEMQNKVNKQLPNWRNAEKVKARYKERCAQLHIPSELYNVELYKKDSKLCMNFRKNHYRINRYLDRFGKNILITDHMEWSTDDIVNASLERYVVEDGFRTSKDHDIVSMKPFHHWTDSKIRCHILSCIVAQSYLRLIELRLRRAGLSISAKKTMDRMHTLHSCLTWEKDKRKPIRIMEQPTTTQVEILKAFGHEIASGVLQASTL